RPRSLTHHRGRVAGQAGAAVVGGAIVVQDPAGRAAVVPGVRGRAGIGAWPAVGRSRVGAAQAQAFLVSERARAGAVISAVRGHDASGSVTAGEELLAVLASAADPAGGAEEDQ